MGRKRSVRDIWTTGDGLIKIQGMARAGMTDEQICKKIGITVATLYNWRKYSPEFDKALRQTKEIVDYEVENALERLCYGFEKDEVTVKQRNGTTVEKTIVRKYYPPNVTAIIWWLKNRQPDRWKDRKEIESDNKNDSTITLNIKPASSLSEDAKRKMVEG